MKTKKHYIFRWKEKKICVTPSRSKTAEECWEYALEWLRPGFKPRSVGREMVRKNGEVIEE